VKVTNWRAAAMPSKDRKGDMQGAPTIEAEVNSSK
jgi:hypothetical protein